MRGLGGGLGINLCSADPAPPDWRGPVRTPPRPHTAGVRPLPLTVPEADASPAPPDRCGRGRPIRGGARRLSLFLCFSCPSGVAGRGGSGVAGLGR